MKFTPEQQAAIDIRGCNVLVAAAAGSGKTGVLTERVLSRLRDGEDIDALLVLTFTNAAAAEMKKRIREKIIDAAETAAADQRGFWQRQLNLIGDADVTTIHSFCLRLLRRHYNLLPGLDPKFRVANEKRNTMLRQELLDAYLEECYIDADEEKRERCYDLLRLFGSRLSDDGLKEKILGLLELGSTQGDPAEWLDSALSRFGDLDFWHETALSQGRDGVALLIRETDADLALLRKSGGAEAAVATLEADLENLESLLDADWERFCDADVFTPKKRRKADDDRDVDDFCKLRREKRKTFWKNRIQPLFSRSFRTYAAEIAAVLPQMETLVALTKEFYRRFRAEKLKKSLLDFDDLQYYAFKLLREHPALAAEYQELFREVLVDEYQDINPLQDQLLSLVAAEGRFFAVGDVKQSIYGFRLADHTRFQDLAATYGEGTPNEKGCLLRLNRNFRSRREVLDLTNDVFTALMNKDAAGMTYGEKEKLRFGATYYGDKDDVAAEFHIVERPGSDPAGDYDNVECQGRFIARRIEEMMASGFQVTTPTGPRPLRYGDITILMRSPNSRGEALAEPLRLRDIPVKTPATAGFLAGRETKLLVAFLAVLDNPLQDIALAAVMRSPLFCFDEDELLALSLSGKGGKLWDAVKAAAEREDDEKIRNFVAEIVAWRQQAKICPVGELVDAILKQYDYTAFWGGVPGGRRRRRCIALFADEARSYQREEGGSLFDFLRYLEHLAENGGDVPEVVDDDDDRVTVMSIHKSKGLEFPVVFLAYAERGFDTRDSRKDLLMDKTLGLGPRWRDEKRRQVFSTLPWLLIRKIHGAEELAEEMRVLYVALTRAKEKLIVVAGDATGKTSVTEKLEAAATEFRYDDAPVLPATSILGESNYSRWLQMSLSVAARDEREHAPVAPGASPALPPQPPRVAAVVRKVLPAEDFERLAKTLSRQKPKPLPAKVSVTSLLPVSEWERSTTLLRPPKFLGVDGSPAAAEKGTAFHLVMEKIDPSRDWDRDGIAAFVDSLRQQGHLRNEAAAATDLDAITAFFASDYGKALKTAKTVRREMSFVGGFKASELFPDEDRSDEIITLQGAIDLIFEDESGRWILLDYKTNDLRHGGEEAFLAKYRRQMDLYAAALRRVYNIDVTTAAFYLTTERRFLRCEVAKS